MRTNKVEGSKNKGYIRIDNEEVEVFTLTADEQTALYSAQYNKGHYNNEITLNTAHPNPEDGAYAIVESTKTIWLSVGGKWINSGSSSMVSSVQGLTGDVVIPLVSVSDNGLMSSVDKQKLNNIPVGATKVEASIVAGNIKINDIETIVYKDADSDNKVYGRKNGEWVEVAVSGINNATQAALDLKANDNEVIKTTLQSLTTTERNRAKSNLDLGNVENTADSDKPISTSMQMALDEKADDNIVVKISTQTLTTLQQKQVRDNINAVEEAPNDGKQYIRKDKSWNEISDLPANNVKFDDGETFQEKYDNGELRGFGIDEMAPAYYDTLITGKETLTNQWRDGKVVYQMLVDIPMVQGVTQGIDVIQTIPLSEFGIYNIDEVWVDKVWIFQSNISILNTPWVRSIKTDNEIIPKIQAYINAVNKLEITNSLGSIYNNRTLKGIIQYTKTTDPIMPSHQLPVPYFDLTTLDVEYRTNEIWNSKPVYKKQLKYNLGSTLGQNFFAHGIANIENAVRLDWAAVWKDGSVSGVWALQFNNTLAVAPQSITASFNRDSIYYWIGQSRSNTDGYFTLYYTKTVDTPSTPSLIPVIVQETGNSTITTMSQKAVTDELYNHTENDSIHVKALVKNLTKTVSLENLQAELDALPKLLMADVTFNVSGGTVADDIVLQNFSGFGNLSILGATSVATTHNITRFTIRKCSNAYISIRGFNATHTTSSGFNVSYCSAYLQFSFCSSTSGDKTLTNLHGIDSQNGSCVKSNGCHISNKNRAFNAGNNGRLSITGATGTNNTYGAAAYRGAVCSWEDTTSTIAFDTKNYPHLGALIINPSGATLGT